jgi:hypothetical protein
LSSADNGALSLDDALLSPRHAHHFESDKGAQQKIAARVRALREGKRLADKSPILNFRSSPALIEIHDGNASAVAWRIHCAETDKAPFLDIFIAAFKEVILLRDRQLPTGEIWHPYLPRELKRAAEFAPVFDAEKNIDAVIAVTRTGKSISFDDREYFSGADTAATLAETACRVAVRLRGL